MSTVVVSPADLAVDALIVRYSRIVEWADALDEAYYDQFGWAVDAMRGVDRAWGALVPSEDDGPVVLACWVAAQYAAVDGAAQSYESITLGPLSSEHVTNVPRCLR